MATQFDAAQKHLDEAVDLGNTATDLLIGGVGGAPSPCELGTLHALIAVAIRLDEIRARLSRA